MAENLTGTNVGNIEYIRRQDVVEECGEWYVEEGTEEGFIGTVSQMLNMFSPADVVGKADIMALLEETEKELTKGTDEMSIARCFIVSIMGIVKCKIMQMGEKKDG